MFFGHCATFHTACIHLFHRPPFSSWWKHTTWKVSLSFSCMTGVQHFSFRLAEQTRCRQCCLTKMLFFFFRSPSEQMTRVPDNCLLPVGSLPSTMFLLTWSRWIKKRCMTSQDFFFTAMGNEVYKNRSLLRNTPLLPVYTPFRYHASGHPRDLRHTTLIYLGDQEKGEDCSRNGWRAENENTVLTVSVIVSLRKYSVHAVSYSEA